MNRLPADIRGKFACATCGATCVATSRSWLLVGFKNPVLFAPARSKKQQEATQRTGHQFTFLTAAGASSSAWGCAVCFSAFIMPSVIR